MPQTIVRLAALLPPRRITDEDFELICRTYAIPPDEHLAVRDFLDECVTTFAKAVTEERNRPGRKKDRLSIQRAARDLHRAVYWLERAAGPAARSGLRAAGRHIGPMVTASWLRRRFPNDRLAPGAHYWPKEDSTGRASFRDPPRSIEVDDLSAHERIRFAEHRPGEVITAILTRVGGALDDARRVIVQLLDGRKPLAVRNYMLAALAEQWHRLDRRPTPGKSSEYGKFCETVFDAIGWPTEGVNRAISDAIKTWRRLYSGARR